MLEKPCKLHTGTVNNNGYGQVRRGGKTILAHRWAYCQHNGLTMADITGIVIRHKCDVRLCTEGTHLEPGTQTDNLNDRKERHRYRKLTRQDAEAIKARLADGRTLISIAREFGVTYQMIGHIRDGRQWA